MELQRYRGDGKRPPGASAMEWKSRPDLYEPSPALVHAVNVSLLLGRPLLVTGEPGTGKTDLAYSVAWEIGLPEPLRFDTRSTSEWKQLFYSFDALARFHKAQGSAGTQTAQLDPRLFIEYQALGLAILRTRTREDVSKFLADPSKHVGPIRSLVLVDEIDKAPRDFANDLLGAIERMRFKALELETKDEIEGADDLRPVVIVSSNSERALPEAFLRRCVYHHVEFPEDTPEDNRLRRIVARRTEAEVKRQLRRAMDARLVEEAFPVFNALRQAGLRKPPATAELIDWMIALHGRVNGGVLTRGATIETLGAVVKRQDDLAPARAAVEEHFKNLPRKAAASP